MGRVLGVSTAEKKHNGYEHVDELRDGEMVLVVTRRTVNGHYTYRLAKEFMYEGEVRHTSYMTVRHFDSIKRLLVRAEHKYGLRAAS